MDCKRFSDLLEELLAERLTDDLRREALEHAEQCGSCRATLEPPSDLVSAILDKTSGSTCDGARELLCEYVDEQLEPTDEELAGMHLEGCADCAALSRTIAQLSTDLPLLAEMQPDAGFVADVMARTIEAGWSRRVERYWRNLLARPRIAWEGAYVGAFIFALIFITPGSPLASVPKTALGLATVNPVVELAAPVVKLQDRVSSEASSAWSRIGDHALDAWNHMTAAADIFKQELGTIIDRFASEQETEEENSNQGEEQ
jgi:predicted anti-sigma-YlaC factor YlaD